MRSKMFYKRFIVIILLIINSGQLSADTFTVTSVADSGPGSLREALESAAANGVAEKDYIIFNLPATDNKVITLTAELPALTSNLVVDATTQPGAFIGQSTTKIKITADRESYVSSREITSPFFMHNAKDVEIYGFYVTGLYGLRFQEDNAQGAGVYVLSSQNITIGAPGKGNLFTINDNGIIVNRAYLSTIYCRNIKIQSNWVGLNTDGTAFADNTSMPTGIFINAEESVVGGDTDDAGNILSGYFSVALLFGGTDILVSKNKFGLDASNTPASYNVRVRNNAPSSGMVFKDNRSNSLFLELIGAINFKITGNHDLINTSSPAGNISLTNCKNGIIGTDNPNDINVLMLDKLSITAGGSEKIIIGKNSFICTQKAYRNTDPGLPQIQVLVNNDTEYSGTASPNSEVYIYNDNTNCTQCSPVAFYQTVTADANGNWKILGDFTNNRFIANTRLLDASSTFTQPELGSTSKAFETVNPTCGLLNGSIKVLETLHVLKVEWYNEQGQKVGEGLGVTGLGPGKYYAKGFNGKCFTRSEDIILYDSSPQISDQNLIVKQPSCGLNSGSISGISAVNSVGGELQIQWVNESNTEVATGLDASGLAPGQYKLIVTNKDNCTKSYGPIVLQNVPAPSINSQNIIIEQSSCIQATGKIKGISATGTGTITYTWKNEAQQTVGSTLDLLNVPGGKYTLEVSDNSGCSPAVGIYDVGEVNGVTIDNQTAIIKNSTCENANGSITGLAINGATSYEWRNEQGQVVGTQADLHNVLPGKYQLKASNDNQCSKTSEFFTIVKSQSTQVYSSAFRFKNASCGLNNGSIEVIFSGSTPTAFRWADLEGNIIGNSAGINSLAGGTYKLYIADEYNCESFYRDYTISTISPLTLSDGLATLVPDQCNSGEGAISGITIQGGSPPYSFTWMDKEGKPVNRNLDLTNAHPGTYTLTVSDQEGCSIQSRQFVIVSQMAVLAAPKVKLTQICAPGAAVIEVEAPLDGEYSLYDSETSAQPLATSTNGMFTITVTQPRSFYVSLSSGGCESARTAARIEISGSALKVSNIITPNSDGINDDWEIKGIENYPQAHIKIFSRYGQEVFSCVGNSNTFKGQREGTTLPFGTYYYIIQLRKGCNPLSGSLTIVR